MTIYTHIILLLFLAVTLTLADDDSLSCNDCVAQDCVYCKGSDFFGYPSICVCQGFDDGFFGSCSDFSFGADPFSSPSDCKFGTSNGESIMRTMIIVPTTIAVVLLLCCCCCCFLRRCQKKSLDLPVTSPSSPTPKMQALFGRRSIKRTPGPHATTTTTTTAMSPHATTTSSSPTPKMQALFGRRSIKRTPGHTTTTTTNTVSPHATTTTTSSSPTTSQTQLRFGSTETTASGYTTGATTTNTTSPPATNPNYYVVADPVESSNPESVVDKMMQDLRSDLRSPM